MGSIKEYWASMSPAERSMEMRRRLQSRGRDQPGKRFTSAERKAIREAQRRRWREQKRFAKATQSPFPVKELRAIAAAHDNPGSIRARLEAIEAAVAQLKADIGL